MKPILEVQHITKKFRILHENKPYLSIRDSFSNIFKKRHDITREDFYALTDVSFSVMEGDALGIIGKNGAGKSTLLKILSKITPPTEGKIISRGRIASLLEVGTGFHPELSGRENIYLNGSILGMRRLEIKSNFDDIVSFSGVSKFLDTPLKHYSSGMQLRLAFAVAAFLEPEILIIDEVLAVGDADFQKKCIGKMDEVSKSGRTILFVSHNLAMVGQLCKTSLLLENGKIRKTGDTIDIINLYTQLAGNSEKYQLSEHKNEPIYFSEIFPCDASGKPVSMFTHDESMRVRLSIIVREKRSNYNLGIVLLDRFKKRVFTINKSLSEFLGSVTDELKLEIVFPPDVIAPAHYSFLFALNTLPRNTVFDWVEDVCRLQIVDNGTELAFVEGQDNGCLIMDCKCEVLN